MEITYQVDYQYKSRSAEKPVSSGNVIRSSGEETPVMFIPDVGDFVEIDGNPENDDSLVSFRGEVISRFFRYRRISDTEVFCHINIVVEESFQDFDNLVNE
ncbi:hypothetical protein QU24_19555 [Pantoea rodasii]|uniref:Uncharacterized protein n=1 Tax=Pantoea rodasii TaxID=1076549 RepID=A0A0B1R033_9GAMM|nr:hypothetical protein [Pantoea rodasii]KHJ66403.1 hypothetical protein QU24_19555 [Pantoea rodasii]